MSLNVIRRMATAALLTVATGAAQAHTGHGTHGLVEGLIHPFGADHLLAMVAVGLWSASALPLRRSWWGPVTFMGALLAGAMLGASGLSLPYLEHAIALSVVLFGVMLAGAQRGLPVSAGLCLVAAASVLHGLAHGAESPQTGFSGYAAGFLLTTAILHLGGISMGLAMSRWMSQRRGAVLGSLGAALGVSGLYLFGQVAT